MQRLEIIRHMLGVMGEAGIVDPESLHPSVLAAGNVLDTQDRDFQACKAWWFNTEYKLTLVQDNNGHVIVPDNTLRFKLSDVAWKTQKQRYVLRGNKVYDSLMHTNVIGRSLQVDIVTKLPIADLPHNAASYLMHQAALSMYEEDDADDKKIERLSTRRNRAWQTLIADQMQAVGLNALDSPFAQQLRAAGSTGSTQTPNTVGGRY